METRYARVTDIDRINELFWELDTDAIESQPEHFRRGKRTDEYLQELITDDKSDFLLAIKDQKIIGFSLLFEKKVKDLSLLVPNQYTYIQDFVITKDYRNHGYGKILLEASKRWAKEHNTRYLRLSVMPENTRGIHFYKDNGMKEQMITMECSL